MSDSATELLSLRKNSNYFRLLKKSQGLAYASAITTWVCRI